MSGEPAQEQQEEALFIADDVSNIIKESVELVLANQTYNHNRVGPQTSAIVEECMKRLANRNKPMKYVCTTLIMQKNGAGLHTASSCYWDNNTDGSRTIRWENKSIYCITTVFGLAI